MNDVVETIRRGLCAEKCAGLGDLPCYEISTHEVPNACDDEGQLMGMTVRSHRLLSEAAAVRFLDDSAVDWFFLSTAGYRCVRVTVRVEE